MRSSQGAEEDAGPVDGETDQLSTSDSEPVGFLGKQIENAKTFVSTALQSLLSQNVSVWCVPSMIFVYLYFRKQCQFNVL